jgi:hypothetical protein
MKGGSPAPNRGGIIIGINPAPGRPTNEGPAAERPTNEGAAAADRPGSGGNVSGRAKASRLSAVPVAAANEASMMLDGPEGGPSNPENPFTRTKKRFGLVNFGGRIKTRRTE